MENRIEYEISIVVATHNGEKFLGTLLDSMLQSTYRFKELIISDDGSTDSTVDVAMLYQKKDDRIKILTHRNDSINRQFIHERVKENFLYGFMHASGDFIAPADQDDIWNPNKLEVLASYIEDNIDVVNAQDDILLEDGTHQSNKWVLPEFNELIWYHGFMGHTCIFRRNLLDLFSHCGLVSWDYVIALYCGITNKMKTIDDCLMTWRRHEEAVTFVPRTVVYRNGQRIQNVYSNIKDRKSLCSDNNINNKKSIRFRDQMWYVFKSFLQNKKHPTLTSYLMSRVRLIDYIECRNVTDLTSGIVDDCKKVLLLCSKQTCFSYLFAAFVSMRVCGRSAIFETFSAKRKIQMLVDSFSKPFRFFYTQRNSVELF